MEWAVAFVKLKTHLRRGILVSLCMWFIPHNQQKTFVENRLNYYTSPWSVVSIYPMSAVHVLTYDWVQCNTCTTHSWNYILVDISLSYVTISQGIRYMFLSWCDTLELVFVWVVRYCVPKIVYAVISDRNVEACSPTIVWSPSRIGWWYWTFPTYKLYITEYLIHLKIISTTVVDNN